MPSFLAWLVEAMNHQTRRTARASLYAVPTPKTKLAGRGHPHVPLSARLQPGVDCVYRDARRGSQERLS
jgi:hypothetical protein